MRKAFAFLIICVLCLMITGCQTAEYKNRAQSSSENDVSQRENSAAVSENTMGDGMSSSILGDENETASTKECHAVLGAMWTPEEETVMKAFPLEQPEIARGQGPQGTGTLFSSASAVLTIDSGMLVYSQTEGNYVNSVLYTFRNNTQEINYNANLFSQSDSLSFMGHDEAVNALEDLIQTLGREGEYTITCYALDSATMNAQAKVLEEKNGKQEGIIDEWTEDKECYYLKATPIIDGIPLLPLIYGSSGQGTYITGEDVSAIISSKGFELFMITNAVDVQDIGDEKLDIISQDEAHSRFTELHDMLLSDETYEIKDMLLGYYPQYDDTEHTSIKFLPAWAASVLVTGESKKAETGKFEYTTWQYIDAQSGKELVEGD